MREPFATPRTFVDVLRRRAETDANRTAFIFLSDGKTAEQPLTYAELDARARAVAATLCARGATGERAVLLFPPGLDYIVAFFGCMYAGTLPVPAYPPDPSRLARTLPRLQAIAADCQARLVLTDSMIYNFAEALFSLAPDLAAKDWIATDQVPLDAAADWAPVPLDGDTLALLQYTSGSTASPKGVMLSHGNLLADNALIVQAFHTSERDAVCGWVPLYHDLGLVGHVLHPVHQGFLSVLMSPIHFLRDPLCWLQGLARYRATQGGGPNFAYDLCVRRTTPEQRQALDLSHWKTAFCGAEPVRYETLRRFAEAFRVSGFEERSFYPCYGMAEVGLFISGKDASDPFLTDVQNPRRLERGEVATPGPGEPTQVLVGCGRSWPGQRLVIVEPATGRRAPPNRIGEIWVAGPHVAQGYYGRPDETARAFGARLADSGEGPFLRTGDLGYLQGTELYIAGRIKDLIVVRGRNLYPQDIEAVVEAAHPAVKPGCTAAFALDNDAEERLVVAAEVDPKRAAAGGDPTALHAELAQAIRQAVLDAFEVAPYTVLLLRSGSLPKTSSGKIQRHACRAEHQAGTLDVLLADDVAVLPAAPGAQSAVRAELGRSADAAERQAVLVTYLQTLVAEALGVPVFRILPTRALRDYGLDSLRALELAGSLERDLGLRLELGRLLDAPTLAALGAELDAALAAGGAATEAAPPLLGLAPDPHCFPLSHGQQALHFVHRLDPTSAAYNVGWALRLQGALNLDALAAAVRLLGERHALLGARLVPDSDPPCQQIAPPGPALVVHPTPGSEAALREAVQGRYAAPFDLEAGPWVRFECFPQGAADHVLLVAAHHIALDGWSLWLVLADLAALYEALARGAVPPPPPPAPSYADYVAWHTARIAGPEGDALFAYWHKRLGGGLVPVALPYDGPRTAVAAFHGASLRFEIAPPVAAGLAELAARCHATRFGVLLAAFQAFLHRLSGQSPIPVVIPAVGRTRREFENTVGHFVNYVVATAAPDADRPFSAFVADVRRTVLEALDHQDFPFALLVQRLGGARQRSPLPPVNASFVWQSPQRDAELIAALVAPRPDASPRWGGLPVAPFVLLGQTGHIDLELEMMPIGDGLAAALHYHAELFTPETVARLAEQFQTVLASLVADPERRLGDLPLLTPAAEAQLFESWAPTPLAFPETLGLHELVAAQAARTPDAVAVRSGGQHLTYRELDAAANRLASRLVRAGVGGETLVGVCLPRTPALITALLAVLKAGGAYVPLDPHYPAHRLATILDDAAARIVLTDSSVRSRVPERAGLDLWCLDTLAAELAAEPAAPPPPPAAPQAGQSPLAYVLYTSGSTGKPKGVAVEHRSAVAFVTWAQQVFSPAELAAVLASTSVCFDLSVFEIFVPLSSGGALVLVDNALCLPGLSDAAGLTLINTVPSAIDELLRLGAIPPTVQTVNLAGEPLSAELVDRLYATTPVQRVYDLYGPTEYTTYATFTLRRPGGPETIGRPIANTTMRVLDERQRPVPPGQSGELYLGGAGLARGYLHRPELTAERFIRDPWGPGRLYRTGDRVRQRDDGQLVFLGRLDRQVKVAGHRIELEEIEAVLAEAPGVGEAAVVVRADGAGTRRLVAYVSGAPSLQPAALRAFAQSRLAAAMVPALFVVLPALPRTPNGKLDRAALPAPDPTAGREHAYVAPTSPIEATVAEVWAQVLGVQRVGRYDNFFELGGSSLLLGRVYAALRERFSTPLAMVDLFQHTTVHALAEHLAGAGADGAAEKAREAAHLERRQQGRSELALRQQRRQAFRAAESDEPTT